LPNQTQTQVTPQDIAYLFLQYAREDFSAIQNATFPTNVSGGTQQGTWDTPVQDYAAWATSIDLLVSMPITITIPAGQAYTWSIYAPYNFLIASLLIGGSESIPPVSLVPFWLDEITNYHYGFDPVDYGPSNPVAGVTIPAVWLDDGSSVTNGGGSPAIALPITPGATYTNAGTTTITQNYTFVFYVRMLLARNLYAKRQENLVGAVPLGDPSSRPLLNLRVAQLVGNQPENNPITSAGAGVTAVTNSGTAGYARALWVSRTLDQLPPSLAGGIPTPQVMMALELDTNSGFAVPNAGQFSKLQVRTAMIYHKRFEILVNNQLPIDPDYTALWYSDNRSNARYEYDAFSNTLQEKYRQYQRRYGRFLPKGVTIHDLIGGSEPEVPMFTPYRGLVTPSVALANMANLKPYPASQTVTRIPTGTALTNAYVTTYDFGVVPVSY
jgi:hypothetical protein